MPSPLIRRKWKGPWRWFDESMLDCCEPLEKVKAEGVSFGKVACLAHCAGANVEAFHTRQSTLDDFRKHVIICTSSEDCHVIISYHREFFNQSCRHESWVSLSKFLMDDVPILLKSEGLNSVPDVLSLICKSLLANAGDFIKWFVEVKRREEDGTGLSQEEKGRLAEAVLQQVRGTELFKYVADWLSSMRSCCSNAASLDDKDSLTEIAASVCCQGAMLLTGGLGENKGFCRRTCVKSLKAKGDDPITVVSGTVVSGGSEQGFDMLIPVSPAKSSCCSSGPSSCVVVHPASDDVLTVLLLALPANSWGGINDEKLLSDILGLVSTERLPNVLQEEVLHLRRQLHFLRCKDKEVCDDLELSSGP